MIYGHSQREAQKIFMGIYGSLMDIFDQKKTVIHDKNNFVSFKNDLWPFSARSAKIFMGIYGSLMDIFDPKKSFMTRIIFVSFMNIYDQKKKFCIQ